MRRGNVRPSTSAAAAARQASSTQMAEAIDGSRGGHDDVAGEEELRQWRQGKTLDRCECHRISC